MNHKQKLGYMALGAVILALGIIIGQVITPDIEAQSNGVFDEISCRSLQVVDENGNTAIKLDTDEDYNRVIIFDKKGDGAIGLFSAETLNDVSIYDPYGAPVISLLADGDYRMVELYDKTANPGNGSITLLVREKQNVISMKGKAGEESITLRAGQEASPFIFIRDRTGEGRWTAP